MQRSDGTGTVTFAMSRILWGNADPNGTPGPDAWKQFGYNIDGVAPSNIAAFCRPPQGGSPTIVHEEGIDGIENAFGHIVLPLLQPTVPQTCNSTCCAIPQPFAVVLSLDQLGAGASYNPLSARVAGGTDLDVDAGLCGIPVPRFDGTDVWSMQQGTSESLPGSYLVNDTWVSGPIAKLSVVYQGLGPEPGPPVLLDIVHAQISMKLDPTHKTAMVGIISGVLPTADLKQRLSALVGSFSTSLCNSPTLQSLLDSVGQASDIMQDGTQDPTRTCDAISIGLGFAASIDQLGSTAPSVTAPDPCLGDAGE
ncbi:MAG TPA: hypothetical protein VMW56_21870 [Candidatus Margulisiibacteriota bacterium]|nr:hypothetical protein [Candidatus Margulisiibacteriota bacterium]